MRKKLNSFNGLDYKKIISGLTGVLMVTTGMLVIIPLSMPNAAAYITPPFSFMTWDQMMFDADMSTGGVAVTYLAPYLYDVHEDIIIDPTSTIMTEGPELTTMDPLMGIRIVVEGVLDASLGGTFTSWSAPGDWEGIIVQNSGFAIMSGNTNPMIITDAMRGIMIDNSAMMGASAQIDNCNIYNCVWGIDVIDDMGNPMIVSNEIRHCGSGIHLQGNTDAQVMGNSIFSHMMDGIQLISVSNAVIIDSNTIYDNRNSGIYLEDSFAFIMNNLIYGWNATPSSFWPGGPAIHMTGNPQWTTTISGNTIIGGSGDQYGIGGLAPDGGHAIWLDNLEGSLPSGPQVVIDNNPLIKGGEGGPNIFDDGLAGAGGAGIYIEPLSDTGEPWMDNYAVIISNNNNIIGGQGGDNNAALNGVSGDGGYGIYVIDDDMTGSINISGNNMILGGVGGNSYADDPGGGNWQVGNGGEGISLVWLHFQVINEVKNNQIIRGGKGGNTTGIGSFGMSGKGGCGISLYGTTNSTILSNKIFGGDGGNNTGMMIMAGNGGHGMHLDYYGGVFISIAMVMDSNSTGGEGGDDYVGGAGPGGGGAGNGGDGLSVTGAWSSGMTFDCNLAGGNGGDTYGDGGFGGTGGRGIHVWNGAGASSWNSGNIIGGDGGDSLYNGPPGFGSWGGNGGYGAYAENAGTTLYLDGQALITGGDGGDLWFDPIGMPGNGGSAIESWNVDSFFVVGSEITVGNGGFNWIMGGNANYGFYGIYLNNLLFGGTTSFNTIHGARARGIAYSQCSGLISNNEIYDCDGGILLLSGADPLVELNDIHNNLYGISCDVGSNPEIARNTIYDLTNVGMGFRSSPTVYLNSVDNSSIGISFESGAAPLIENCTITNSRMEDFWLTGDSHPVLLNTTSDKILVFNDALSDLTMNWFMHTQVVDQTLAPVGGANVWINDTFGTNILSGLTPVSGWINWTVVTEYIEDQAARTYYTAHNGTAISGLQTGYATPEPFMDASREVIIVLGAPAYNIFLDQGWNLVSLPLIQADESLDQVLRSIDGKWDYVMAYDANDPDPWKTNLTYRPDPVNDLDTLNHSVGFWINIITPSATLTVIGNIPVSTDIILYAGWNLVGYASFTEDTISNVLLGTGYDGVRGFDPADPYRLTDLLDTYVMKPGEAYWVRVPVDTVWTVTNP